MKKKKILFVGLCEQEQNLHPRLYERLKPEGYDALFATHYKRHAERLQRCGLRAFPLADHVYRSTQGIIDIEAEHRAINREYPFSSLKVLYFADRELQKEPEKLCIERSVRYIRSLEKTFEEEKIDILISSIGGEIGRTSTFYVAQKMNIPTYYLNYFHFYDTHLILRRIDADLLNVDMTQEIDISEEEWKRAEEIIEQTHQFKHRLDKFITPRIEVKYVGKFFSRFIFSYFTDPYAYPKGWLRMKVAEKISRTINKYLLRPVYNKPVFSEDYIFFPFHHSQDYQLKGRAPHCAHQEFIVRLIADAIPEGFKLYIKEHPQFVGGISPRILWGLNRIPNVRLIPYDTPTDAVIKHARAIITVNSSVGFESITHQKSVITLGNSFYRGKGLTLDIEDLSKLREHIIEGLKRTVHINEVKKFIACAYRKTKRGSMAYNVDLSDENITKIVSSLKEAIETGG